MTTERKMYVGMDVHKETVVAAVLPAEAPAPTLVKTLPNEPRRLKRFFERLSREDEVWACYEASGAGYVLQRALTAWGHHCEVVAPSLVPRRAGERRKHDRHDATQLARLYRAGELVVIHVPSEAEERARDLVRCRATFQREILRSRHYLRTLLARRGFVYPKHNWTQAHFAWIRRLLSEGALEDHDAIVVGEYLALLEYKIDRRDELDRRIEALALEPAYQARVDALCCFRGIDTHSAMVLLTELGDWQRFRRPTQLMAYLGLVPSEHSSGDRQRKGSITKAGNSYCRHVLVQAAWCNRLSPRVGIALKRRQHGQPAAIVAHARKAQHRLYRLFRRLETRRNRGIATVAVARELTGFLWAVMQAIEVEPFVAVERAA
jgi:transposase